ncbi:MAG: Phytochrome, two-component sensor histidine kinase [Myxococcaceae bacterium]|nr:Phytochrome, two-component sensor histidine kinase [Myxococcaceae bacterium]
MQSQVPSSEALRALRAAESAPDFRLLFESSPALLLVLDPALRIVAVTEPYLRATQTERAAILGLPLFEVFPDNPDERDATFVTSLRRSLERVLSDGAPDAMAVQKYDIQVSTPHGLAFEARYWRSLNTPVLGPDGHVALIIHRVEDVTESVLLPQEQVEHRPVVDLLPTRMQQMEDALVRAHDAFQRFFTLSLDLMCICGTDGYFRRVNPAFLKLGYTQEELLSKPMVEFMHPDDRARTEVNLRKLEAGASTVGSQNRYLCKDGSYRWISWNSTPEGDGTVYAIGRDITDDKRVDDELRRAQALAESANRELESFSYTVAHDLRAPLRAIDGFSLALLEDYEDKLDEEGKGYLHRVRAGAQRMAHLIDDLLALSRLSRSELQVEQVDLSKIAGNIVEQLRANDPERAVEVQIAPGLSAIADPQLIASALENLIGNAWKFTSKREQARIEVGVTTKDEQRVLFVRDNGAGFDMAYQHKLFGVFQRLHTVQEFEGTGIGLASVQRIIHRHGGRIWPEAAVEQGAAFYFTLPGEELS